MKRMPLNTFKFINLELQTEQISSINFKLQMSSKYTRRKKEKKVQEEDSYILRELVRKAFHKQELSVDCCTEPN